MVALALLVFLPLVALSIVNLVNDREHLAEDTYARTTELVSVGVGSTTALVEQTDLLLQTIDRTTDPVSGSCSAELDATLAPDTVYENLYAVDEDGTVLCTVEGDALTDHVSDTVWFRRTTERDDLTVTAAAVGVASAEARMIISRPREDPAETDEVLPGQVASRGLLAASIDLQALVAYTATLDLPPDSIVQFLDSGGRVVARTEDIDEYRLEPAPLFPRVEGSEKGTLDGRGVDGVDRLYSYERLDIGGDTLYVVAGIGRDEAYDAADERLAWSLVIVAVLGAVVAVVAIGASRTLVVTPIDRLRAAMAGFRSGDVDRRAGDIGGPAEVVELGIAFDEMADEIQRRFADLQRVLQQLEESSEAERQAIAAGIHDETLQNLGALRIRVQLLRRTVPDEERRADLDHVIETLDLTSTQLRDLLFDLRPPNLDQVGLAATLRETLEVRFGDVLDGWSVTGDLGPEVSTPARILLYRVAQQALANVREHAGARRVDMRIGTSQGRAWMEVADDGRGFDVAVVERHTVPGHIGLRVMRDRARALDGELTVTSVVGEGTTVRVEMPLATVGDATDDA